MDVRDVVGGVRAHEAASDERHARERKRNILSVHESDSCGRIVGRVRHSVLLSTRSVTRKLSVWTLSTLARQALMQTRQVRIAQWNRRTSLSPHRPRRPWPKLANRGLWSEGSGPVTARRAIRSLRRQ